MYFRLKICSPVAQPRVGVRGYSLPLIVNSAKCVLTKEICHRIACGPSKYCSLQIFNFKIWRRDTFGPKKNQNYFSSSPQVKSWLHIRPDQWFHIYFSNYFVLSCRSTIYAILWSALPSMLYKNY